MLGLNGGMVRTHGRSRAARRDPSPAGDPFPEIAFDPEAPSEEALRIIREGAPWVLEIGTGNGVFLVDEAGRRPGDRFLGVERDAEFFFKMKKRVMRLGLTNVRCIRGQIEDVLDVLIPDGSLDEVILNFSDPWPKRRHRARRVFGTAFLERMERTLRPGGRLRFKTDVGWYFNLAVTDVRRRGGWVFESAGPADGTVAVAEEWKEGPGGPDDETQPMGVVTNFERKGREQGREIWGFIIRRDEERC